MSSIKEGQRHASPGGRPQPLAFHEETLWVGSWDTLKVYAIDTKTWSVVEEHNAPGQPYGLASIGGELRAVVSIGEDDDRYFYRVIPGEGFVADSKTPCPELTGSHLATDGTVLYLAQMTFGKILVLDAAGNVQHEVKLPSRCAGIGFGEGGFHIITADEEFEKLSFATLDVSQAAPAATEIAPLPEEARSLAFDGTSWWTNLRELSATMSFTTA